MFQRTNESKLLESKIGTIKPLLEAVIGKSGQAASQRYGYQ